MITQGLTPAVQHRDETDSGTEMFGVGGNEAQRLGGCPKQDGVDDRLVLEGYGCNLGGQREDHVEIRHRQKVARLRFEPVARGRTLTRRAGGALSARRAMPVAAGIIGDTDCATGLAALNMAAKRGRPAQFDRRHDAALHASKVAVVSMDVGRAMAAENIRHLQGG